MLKKTISRLMAGTFFSLFTLTSSAYATCTIPQDRPIDVFARPVGAINTQVFVDKIQETVGDDVMGYVVILRGKNGRRLAEIDYGYGRTPCEPEGVQKFNRNTVVSWASVSKMITTAAVLHKVEKSENHRLTDRIINYLPDKWEIQSCSGESNRCWRYVNVQHLLNYQSGFRKSGGRTFQQRLESSGAVTEGRIGKRSYNNSHFSIWHYMGGFFAPKKMEKAEAEYQQGEITYDDYIFALTRSIWKNYLQKNIYDPIGVQGACSDVSIGGNNFAKLYNSNTSKRGYKPNELDTSNCASGGVVMSAKDMSIFIYSLTQTNKIISRGLYDQTLALTNKDVSGWNGSFDVAGGYAFRKAGGASAKKPSRLPDNSYSGSVGAQVMAFPNGMTAVMVINSKRPKDSQWSLKTTLADAYNAGVAAKPRRTSP